MKNENILITKTLEITNGQSGANNQKIMKQ